VFRVPCSAAHADGWPLSWIDVGSNMLLMHTGTMKCEQYYGPANHMVAQARHASIWLRVVCV
jgi:hypothetical protein